MKKNIIILSPYIYTAFLCITKFINNVIADLPPWRETADYYILIDRFHMKAWYFTFYKWKLEYIGIAIFLICGPRERDHKWIYKLWLAWYIFEILDYALTYNQSPEIPQIALILVLTLLIYYNFRYKIN